jgi:IclR family pca regulon transcriptional regulator
MAGKLGRAAARTAASEPRLRLAAAPLRQANAPVALADALGVLDLFSAVDRALTLEEIVARSGLARGLCERTLAALATAGLLARKPDGDAFAVGVRSLELADAYERENPLIRMCLPFLQDIRDRVNETTMLAVRWGDHRVNILQLLSDHHLHQDVPEGQKRPLYVGSGGKVLLAAMAEAELADYLDRVPLKPLSQTTCVNRERLLREIEAVRRENYAETFSDGNAGGANMGTGIRGPEGETLAALVVAVPLYRYSSELRARIRELLLNASEEISERLAGRIPPARLRWQPRSGRYAPRRP